MLVAKDAAFREVRRAPTVAPVEIRAAVAHLTQAGPEGSGIGEPAGRGTAPIVEVDRPEPTLCANRLPHEAEILRPVRLVAADAVSDYVACVAGLALIVIIALLTLYWNRKTIKNTKLHK